MKLGLKEWIAKITELENKPLFHEETVSASGLSNSTYYGTFSLPLPAVNGYMPIAVKKLSVNQVNKNIYNWTVNSNSLTLVVGVANVTLSGTIASLYIGAEVVYMRVGGYCVSQLFQRFQPFPRLEVV